MSEIDEKEIERRFEVISQFELSPEVTARDLKRVRRRLTEQASGRLTMKQKMWRTIMKSRIAKLSVAAVVIVGVLIGIYHSMGGASVAFADVLEHIQGSSYTFDLTVVTVDQASTTVRAMVLEPGRIRLEGATGLEKISSIIDTTEGKSIILFHQQKAGFMFTLAQSKDRYAGAVGIFTLCMRPIENLWNLRDGTEQELGRKEIDGQTAEGFRVFQEDQYFQNDITIRAHGKTGVPILVEIISTSQDDSSKSMKWIMNNFNLDVELDESMFSLELPPGYTLAHELSLDELQGEAEPSAEGQKIEKMLALWPQGQKNEAIEILLGIGWTKTIKFSEKPYLFTVTEKQYISLRPDDQKDVITEVMSTASAVRQIAKEVIAAGRAAMSAKDYEEAEHYFDAGLQLGRLLTQNPDSMLIVRLVGIAVERIILKEMISLYTATNNQEKLRAAERELKVMEAESEAIKRKAAGK